MVRKTSRTHRNLMAIWQLVCARGTYRGTYKKRRAREYPGAPG